MLSIVCLHPSTTRCTTVRLCTQMEISTASDRFQTLPQAITPPTSKRPHRVSTPNSNSLRTTSTISSTTPSSDNLRGGLRQGELLLQRALHPTIAPTSRGSNRRGHRSRLGPLNLTTASIMLRSPGSSRREGKLPLQADLLTTALMHRSSSPPSSPTAGMAFLFRKPRSRRGRGVGTRTTRPINNNQLQRLLQTSILTITRSTTLRRNSSRKEPELPRSHLTTLKLISTHKGTKLTCTLLKPCL